MSRRSVGLCAGLLLGGLVLAGHLSAYDQYLGVTLLAYAVCAQAWNVLSGYSGQLSLGVGAFVGVGGYTSGLLMLHQGVGWIPSTAIGTVFSGIFAFVLGFPLLRLRGSYFAVGTLAAALALGTAGQLWTFAGAEAGFVLPSGLPSSTNLLRAAVVAFVLAMGVVLVIRDSTFGTRMVAVRDHEQAAAGIGISTFKYRMAALVLSGLLTGLAGALIAMQTITVDPISMFSINWTVNATLMVVVGGTATVVGPLIGVVLVYYVLTQELQSLEALSAIIEGGLLMLIMRFSPGGLWPMLLRAAGALRRRRSNPASRAVPTAITPALGDQSISVRQPTS